MQYMAQVNISYFHKMVLALKHVVEVSELS